MDFRSDTVTIPTPQMKEAMFKVQVGDDVYGEDKITSELETKLAGMFGMEAGLFFPSGTMANQIAIRAHVKPGDDVLCSDLSHIYHYEGGGVALNAGANLRLLSGDRGVFTQDTLRENIMPDDVHFPNPKLVVVENTVNKGGGKIWPITALQEIKRESEKHDLITHLDGARIFNAIQASDYNAIQVGQCFDTISICLSKGLGCPVGSVLIGEKKFIHQAKRYRKSAGGGMRQTGFLAAAGIYALENNIERLKEDHHAAKLIYNATFDSPWIVDAIEPETNIVLVQTKQLAADVIVMLNKKGVQCSSMGDHMVRFVTHLQTSSSDIKELIEIIKSPL